MLRIAVELLPQGDDSRAREIARLEVANVTPRHANSGEHLYDYTITQRTVDGRLSAQAGHVTHRRDDGVLELLRRVLEDATDGRPR